MPLIDLKCENGHVREAYRPLSMWPTTPPCEACGAATQQIHLPVSSHVRSVDPVVVYQAPDGTMRFPPDTTSASTAMYDHKGFTRIELRGFADVRRFEKHMNTAELSNVRRRVEHQQEQHERAVSERRAEGRRCLEQGFQIPERNEKGEFTGRMETVRLSERGRAIMRAAQDLNDRRGGPKVKDVGFRVEAYSEDRSNRAADPRRRGQ